MLGLNDAFTIDEGAYGVQVRALDRGHWEFDYRAEAVDREGRWLPLYRPEQSARGWFPYVKHPAYPAALLAATRVVGDVLGLYLWTAIGALGVAVAAWLLAAELDARLGRGAFWLAASGPVMVNAYVIWAHAPSAALAGFATLGAVRLVRGGTGLYAAVVALLVSAGVLLRSEGLLFAVALALAVFVVGLEGRSTLARIGAPGLWLAAAAGAALAEQRWLDSIMGTNAPVQGFRGENATPFAQDGSGVFEWARGRVEGGWHSLLQGSFDDRTSLVLVTAALVLVAYGALAARRRRLGWERDAGLALTGAAGLYAVRFFTGPGEPITGLFAAWPVALLGLALLPARWSRAEKLLLAVVVLFSLAVLATQYRIGGGREWGGRFFFPVLVPLAVLAWSGLRPRLVDRGRTSMRMGALVCALAVVPTALGLVVVGRTRAASGAVVDEIAAARPDLVLTHVRGLPPFAWRTYPEIGWMVAPPGELREATSRLRNGGVDGVTVVGPRSLSLSDLGSYDTAEDITGPEVRRRGWRVLRLSVLPS